MLQPEQKNVALMNDLVETFSSAIELEFEAIARTHSTEKVCRFLDIRMRFMGRKKNSGVVASEWKGLGLLKCMLVSCWTTSLI